MNVLCPQRVVAPMRFLILASLALTACTPLRERALTDAAVAARHAQSVVGQIRQAPDLTPVMSAAAPVDGGALLVTANERGVTRTVRKHRRALWATMAKAMMIEPTPPTAKIIACQHGSKFPVCATCVGQGKQLLDELVRRSEQHAPSRRDQCVPDRGGHVQSLILAAVFLITGFQTWLIALLVIAGRYLLNPMFRVLANFGGREVMAGDLQDADISDRIRVLSQTHDARFLGFVDPTTFFPQIDVLLAPSIWHEPFGRITIEAFAHGVPVIATNRGGLPDIVQDGINGWIFDPDRLDDLVAILQRVGAEIDRDPAGLQQRCLDRAQDYLPYKIGDRYLETYREVADLKRATRPVVIDRVRGVYEREARALNLGTSLRTRIPQRERKPLKALIVSGEFPKLSETFVLNHITGLIDLGVDVKVLHTRSGAPHARQGAQQDGRIACRPSVSAVAYGRSCESD